MREILEIKSFSRVIVDHDIATMEFNLMYDLQWSASRTGMRDKTDLSRDSITQRLAAHNGKAALGEDAVSGWVCRVSHGRQNPLQEGRKECCHGYILWRSPAERRWWLLCTFFKRAPLSSKVSGRRVSTRLR